MMINWFKYLLLATVFICPTYAAYGQCPEDESELLINTQDKYDRFFELYPNCREFHVVKVNGKFTGDPRPVQYVLVLTLCFVIILIALKFVIKFLRLT